MSGIVVDVARTRNVGMEHSDREGALVVLHGHASDAEVAAGLAERLDPAGRWHHIAPRGPLAVGDGWAWFDDTESSLGVTRQLLGGLLGELTTQGPLRIFGRSQGAAAALVALSASGTPMPDALVISSGFLPEARDLTIDLTRFDGVRVLIQHGRHDDVVPAFFATDLGAVLQTAGAAVEVDLDDGGHGLEDVRLERAREWLAAQ